jgi:hypothetical protein
MFVKEAMMGKYIERLCICAMLLVISASIVAAADSVHPLEPVVLSSP